MGYRRKLWGNVSEYTLFPAHDFNKTGMSCHRFEQLCSFAWWNNEYVHRQESMSHAKPYYQFVQDFVDLFNDHRSEIFSLSDLLCADESISNWNRLGEVLD